MMLKLLCHISDRERDRDRGERGGVGERGNTRRNRSRDRSPRRSRSPESHRARRRSRSRSPGKKQRSRRRKCSLYWDVPPPGMHRYILNEIQRRKKQVETKIRIIL